MPQRRSLSLILTAEFNSEQFRPVPENRACPPARQSEFNTDAHADARERDEEVAQEGRHCGRAAWNSTTSARLRLADDLHYKVRLSLSASDVRSRRT